MGEMRLQSANSVSNCFNTDLTISRCKRKLFDLKKYIKSISKPRTLVCPEILLSKEIEQKVAKNRNKHFQYFKNDLTEHRNNEFNSNYNRTGYFSYNNNNNQKKNLDSELESETSYNSSFVDEIINRYNNDLDLNISKINCIKNFNSFHEAFGIQTPKKIKKRFEDFKIEIFNRPDLKKNSESSCHLSNQIETQLCFECLNRKKKDSSDQTKNLMNKFDPEAQEIIERLDNNIKNLEYNVSEKSEVNKCRKELNCRFKILDSEFSQNCSNIETKLVSLAVNPPKGISCSESSFLPYLCTLEELNILRKFVSINEKACELKDNSFEIKGVGKIFCCHARKRFLNYIRRLYNSSLSLLKLRLLVFIGEPEMLLVNTLGKNPLFIKEEFKFYEFDILYKMEEISRFIICLIVINGMSNICTIHEYYPIKNFERILPTYIVNTNVIS